MKESPLLHNTKVVEQLNSSPQNEVYEYSTTSQKLRVQQKDDDTDGFSLRNKGLRNLGSIFTPSEIADYLTTWTIRDPHAQVLDLGIGNGAFVWSALRRLESLGALPGTAQLQIHGAEVYEPAFLALTQNAKKMNCSFPNLLQGDFLTSEFPEVDAIIGNPPYVRRQYLSNVDGLRKIIEAKQPDVTKSLSRLADLYIYFLIYGSSYLKEGGRLGVIVADSWLGVNYGKRFKEFLKQYFDIERIIAFDRKVFDVDVKTVMLLATKRSPITKNKFVDFIRVKNGLPIQFLNNSISVLNNHKDIGVVSIQQKLLDTNQIWHRYFSDADILNELSSHPLMSKFEEQARTRIGVQTLAKDFFVMTPETIQIYGIESEYITPMVHSIRSVTSLVIQDHSTPAYYLFYCGKSKEELIGTNALDYILQGETKLVSIRGKDKTVVGYHNKNRIQQDFRTYWYSLVEELERRSRATILIPRLIYKNLTLIWNKALYVPGELFIEFILPKELTLDTEVYLAILSSSISEIMIRSRAQVYGGGTCNISPGLIKTTPLLDARKISSKNKQLLRDAYIEYVTKSNHDRHSIDLIIYDIMKISNSMQKRIQDILIDMRSGKGSLYQFSHE